MMTELELVGDVSDLSNEQKEFITKVVQEREFNHVIVDIQPLGKAGDNFAANVKRITVEKDGKIFKMVAKVAPKNVMIRAITNSAVFFQNEHVMYTQVLPKFTELEKAANIPKEERFSYATCYGTYMEAPNEIVLLEDLEVTGFKMFDKIISLTDENVRLVLKNFAILHSLSYALKHQEPETFQMFCGRLLNIMLLSDDKPEMESFLSQIDEDVQLLLKDDKYKHAVKNAVTQMIPNAVKLLKKDNLKYSVIQQGDSWTNNIMYRFEDDKTVECCIIDYQLSNENSPVADLHYMIFTSTDHATRMKHYHDWIDYYHSALDKRLNKFGLEANNVYTREQLDADLRRYGKFILGHSIMAASLQVREAADATVFVDAMNSLDTSIPIEELTEQVKLSATNSDTIRKCKERIEGIVDSFIEFGYL